MLHGSESFKQRHIVVLIIRTLKTLSNSFIASVLIYKAYEICVTMCYLVLINVMRQLKY